MRNPRKDAPRKDVSYGLGVALFKILPNFAELTLCGLHRFCQCYDLVFVNETRARLWKRCLLGKIDIFPKYSDTIAPKKRCFWRRKSCRFYACFSLKTVRIEGFWYLGYYPIRGPKPQKRVKNQRETYKSSGEPRQICYCLVKPAGFLTSEKRHFSRAFFLIKTPLKGVFGVWRS